MFGSLEAGLSGGAALYKIAKRFYHVIQGAELSEGEIDEGPSVIFCVFLVVHLHSHSDGLDDLISDQLEKL